MANPSPEAAYAPTPVEDGHAACRLKGRTVPVSDCVVCRRGFIVQLESEAPYALCPTDASSATVGEIMSRKVTAVRPNIAIESVILLLVDEGVQAVPVIDAQHRPIGMVSKSDLVFDDYEWAERRDEAFCLRRVARFPAGLQTEGDLFLDELLASKTVEDIMSGEPLTVTEQTRVVDAAKVMGDRRVHSCPVVDSAGVLKGMVTTLDIVRWVGARR